MTVFDWPSGRGNAGWPSPPSAQMLPGRVLGWPRGTQVGASPAQRLLSQAVGWWDAGFYRDGDRFLRNRGTGGELLDLRLGSSILPNSNDPLFLPAEDRGYVYHGTVLYNFMSVPDANDLDITGDIDIRVLVAPDAWVDGFRAFLTKRTFPDQSSWVFLGDNTTKTLRFAHYADGTNTVSSVISTAAHSFQDGRPGWIRVTLDVDNGAGGHTVTFYTSTNGTNWTQLGAPVVTAGTTSIYSSTAPVRTMYFEGADAVRGGKFYRAQVFNGIDGTKVLDIDCDVITSGSATSFTSVDSGSRTVTINRSTSGRKAKAMPSRRNGGKDCFLLGTDDYMEQVHDGALKTLLSAQQGASLSFVVAYRQWATPVGSAPYLSARRGSGTPLNGWMIRAQSTAQRPQLILQDPAGTQININATTIGASGDMVCAVAVIDREAKVASMRGIDTGTASIKDLGDLNPRGLRVGVRLEEATGFQDFEFMGAAIFRRALTPAETQTIVNYYTGA